MKLEPMAPLKDTLELRNEIVEACLHLSDLGFCIGTWGNVSVRVEEGFIITPSRVNYATMTPEDLVVCDMEGVKLSGKKPASSEMELHRVLLVNRPDLTVFIHTHAPYSSSIAVAHKTIPVVTEDMAQIIGGEVKCTNYTPGGRHRGLAEAALDAMGPESAAVLLANHGVVVGGRDISEAVVACRVLEKAAMIMVCSAPLGGCTTIPDELVEEERNRFLYKYGKEETAIVR